MNYVQIVNVDSRKMVHIRTGTQGVTVVNNYCCKKFAGEMHIIKNPFPIENSFLS